MKRVTESKGVTDASHLEDERCDRFVDRVKWIIGTAESESALSRKVGVAPSTLAKWKNGESEPTLSNLIALAAAGNVSVLWLATGEGGRTRPPVSHVREESPAVYRLGDEGEGEEFMLAPLMEAPTPPESDVRFSIAAPDEAAQELTQAAPHMAFRRDYLSLRGLDAERLVVIPVRGDGMDPTLINGDLVLVDTRATGNHGDGIYVLRVNGSILIKRLQWSLAGDLYIRSDNPRYREEILKADQLGEAAIIGKVVWFSRSL